ncbi:glycosyltransferase family 39 protein [Amycolatopsis sp. NPDC051373]|uniref:glycosyltransferase family 39 protein n=1 Tax=Amycolatopsis sp. NPDC051373 TaxID=3155801 RepID=UPI00344B2866
MTAVAIPAATPKRADVTRPRWVRPALAVLLAGTAALYLVDLSASGWANAFYSAAAQAGAQSWKAWFFGSSDAANGITVDKTPAALWVMGLSTRLFGVNAWSVLVPQALMGVGSTYLLYATVRRTSGAAAGLLAATILSLTPAAALIFRFNNPDALLVLLLIAAAYCTVRAIEKAGPKWLALAGVAVGFGFLAKMLQAFLVLPALGLAYLIAAPTPLGKRLLHLAGAVGAVIVSAGWYLAVVALWPAADRPYIGGSQDNSLLGLTFGYNGFGRITGDETGSVGGGRGWGTTGLFRLFGSEMAGGIAWLLPAALLALGAGLWFTRRALRTDQSRAALVIWGGWLLVTAIVFSYMGGIIHPYYTIALAPAVAALVGTAAVQLWRLRDDPAAAGVLSGGLALTAVTSYVLLIREPSWQPWLAPAILVAALLAAVAVFFVNQLGRTAARGLAVLGLVTLLAATGAYTIATAATPHSGAIPSAGPATRRGFGGGTPGRGFGGPGGVGGGRGRAGGLLGTATPGPNLTALLQAPDHTWTAATVGSNNAAGYQLASNLPVLAVGGFNGTDPYPTLAQFQQYVRNGQIHYFLGDGLTMQGSSGSDYAQQIATWVADNYQATTVDGVTVYDLTT